MVDLSSGPGGPIEWNFNNYIFLVAGLLVFSVVGKKKSKSPTCFSIQFSFGAFRAEILELVCHGFCSVK